MPRARFETLLSLAAADLDGFLAREILLRALPADPPPALSPLQFAALQLIGVHLPTSDGPAG